jgi:hypothetical protein
VATSLGGTTLKDSPGGGGTHDFAGGHRDGDGPVFVYEWNSAAQMLEPKATVG